MTLAQILIIMAAIESRNVNIQKPGPNGELGIYQVTPIAREQVNFTFGSQFEEHHMLIPIYNKNCAELYLMYLKDYYDKRNRDKISVEFIVRNYVGGEKGYLRRSSRHHWATFKAEAESRGITIKHYVERGK